MSEDLERRFVVSSEKELCLGLEEICSQPLEVIFDIAYPCGNGFFVQQQECCIPTYVVKKALEGVLQTGLDWCKEQLCAGNNFKLKIDLEIPLKLWYVNQHKDAWLGYLVDVKGGKVEITNRSYMGTQEVHHPGFFKTAELLWKEFNSELSMKKRTLEVY